MGLWFSTWKTKYLRVISNDHYCLVLHIPLFELNIELCYRYCSYLILSPSSCDPFQSCWAHSVVSVLCSCSLQRNYDTTNITLVLLKSWTLETAKMSLKGSWTVSSLWESFSGFRVWHDCLKLVVYFSSDFLLFYYFYF